LSQRKNVSNSQTILSQGNCKCLKLFCMLALQNDLYVCMYVCMATWSFYQGCSAKNDLSTEGLCDFCTRETFLQSVPGPCNWEQIAGHYDLWVIISHKTIQKYFLGGASCQDCRFPLQMVPHLFALLQVSTHKIAKLWVIIFICPTMHFSNSQTILFQTFLSQSN
jgi:hypothetical protein